MLPYGNAGLNRDNQYKGICRHQLFIGPKFQRKRFRHNGI